MMPGTPSCHYIEGNGIVEATSSFTGGTMTVAATGGHTICTLKYADNPAGTPTFTSYGNFWDVYLDRNSGVGGVQALFGPAGGGAPGPGPGPQPSSVASSFTGVGQQGLPPSESGTVTDIGIYYWDGDEWHPCSNQQVVDGFVEVTINNSTRPSLSDLTGQIFADGEYIRQQYGGGSGPTVGGQVMMIDKAQLLTQWIGLPMRLMLGFVF